jgi:hypothetical protein
MVMSQDQNAGRSHNMKIKNSSSDRVGGFKYLGTTAGPLSTGALNSCLRRMTIPDSLTIQFDLLNMSMVLFQTCRGL